MNIRYIFICSLFLISTKSFAGASSGWGTITEFYVHGTGTAVRVKFSEPIVNPDGCTGTEYYIRELDESAGSSRFYSALLAAYTSKSPVNIYINGCTSSTWWGKTRPKMHEISIKN